MKQYYNKKSITEIIDNNGYCPMNINIIPNNIGINLCAVDSIEWIEREDCQLVSLTINFIPSEDPNYLKLLKINNNL